MSRTFTENVQTETYYDTKWGFIDTQGDYNIYGQVEIEHKNYWCFVGSSSTTTIALNPAPTEELTVDISPVLQPGQIGFDWIGSFTPGSYGSQTIWSWGTVTYEKVGQQERLVIVNSTQIDSESDISFETFVSTAYPTTRTPSVDTDAQVIVSDRTKASYGSVPTSATYQGVTYAVTIMNECFKGCTNLITPPSIPNAVTNMAECFRGCTSMTSAPNIPSNVTWIDYCFYGCTSLSGNIVVNNPFLDPDAVSDFANQAFSLTSNDIFIIDGSGETDVDTSWKSIASMFQNVHYEADDNPAPVISNFNITRVETNNSTTPYAEGLWLYITATFNVYTSYIPNGWTNEVKSRTITKDSTTISPTWSPSTISSYPVNVYCWVNVNDSAAHVFTLSISDSIKSGNTEKKSNTSVLSAFNLPKIFALVDYYHDGTSNTEGMAIGKFAEHADLLDIAMATEFSDLVTTKADLIVEDDMYIDLDNINDADLIQNVNQLGWTTEQNQLFDAIYPVGSCYETYDDTFDPNTAFYGTWVEVTKPSSKFNSGSKTVNSSTTYNLCSLTLDPYTEYVVMGYISASIGTQISVGAFLNASNVAVSNIQSYNRLVQHSGGGPNVFGYIKTGSSSGTVTLSCYGYYTTSHTENGYLWAVPINIGNRNAIKWRRTA